MGEIADGLINGDSDFYTGEYIGPGQGFPRTRNKSLKWEKRNYTYSKDTAFKGLRKYLKRRLLITDITDTVNEYIPAADQSLKQKCLIIQNKWGEFIDWINAKYGPPERKTKP